MNDSSDTVVLGHTQQSKPLLNAEFNGLEVKIGPVSVSSREVTETDSMTEDITSADSASEEDLAFDDLQVKNAFLAKFPQNSLGDIEDIYPCTPLQEGILMSQTQETEDYIIRATMELHAVNGATFDLKRLQKSWESIVRQSSILRTVFVQSTSGDGLFQQVVLRHVPVMIHEIQSETLNDITTRKTAWEHDRVAPHCLTFCKSSQGPDGLQLEIHHGVSDAIASMKILHELMRLYDDPSQRLRGVPFRNFVQHLQSSSDEEKRLNYWQEFLADSQPSMFPALRVGLAERPTQRRRRQVLLNREGVLGLVKSSNVSFSMLFHVAWSVLLREYLAKDDVSFGYISSGRHNVPLPDIQEALGPYISMMIARARMDHSTTLMDLASQLRQNIANSGSYEQCSLASIQSKMQFNGGLFNTLVDVQRRPKLRCTSEEISLNLIHVHTVAEYDVVINIEDTGDELLAALDYKTDLLGEADAENIISCFTTIVDQFIQDPRRRIAELNLSSEAHYNRLAHWNGAASLHVTNACAHELFEVESARHPDELAVCSLDIDFTYRQLNLLSARLATHLVSLGAGPGILIPFCMEKSPWAIVSMMGAMKAGAAFVPVDPSAPANRLRGIFGDTSATIIIASPSTLSTVEQVRTDQTIFVVDEGFTTALGDVDVKSTHAGAHASVGPQDTAYVLFTSGSTGKPKGVVVPHQALCCSMYAHGPATGIERTTRALQFGSYTFDSVIAEIFTVLVHGGCVCVPSDEDRMNNVPGFIKQLDVNWAMLTPTFVRTLDPKSIPGVRTLVLIGEAVDKDCLDTWLGRVRLFNGYGPTETTVICVARQFPENSQTDPTNIGKPVGCRAWVVNPANHNSLSAIGAIGELVVEGPNITRGYLGDPDKTSKSFIANPSWASFFHSPSSTPFTFYKTGDLVRQLSDGSLKFCGRADSQVKVNGQRLELGEVETHLLNDVSTVQVLAEVPKSGAFKGRLVAVLCLSGASELQKQEDLAELQLIAREHWNTAAGMCGSLNDKLQSALPAYMVPTVWIPVQKMPLLPSGKLDRRQIRSWLSTIDGDTLKAANEFQTSDVGQSGEDEKLFRENTTANQLRKLWAQVLSVPEHTICSSNAFLSVGGDSISAMKVVSKARAQGISITVQEILQHRTIAALISHLQQQEAISEASEARGQQLTESKMPLMPTTGSGGSNFEFWGMAGRPNQPGRTLSSAFEMDPKTTSAFLEAGHEALRTEPIELLIGIALYAFKISFKGRHIPIIFTEEYIRSEQLADDDSFLLLPVSVDSTECTDISQTTRLVKDIRRTLLQDVGRVACHHHNESDRSEKEILFKYHGLRHIHEFDSDSKEEKPEGPRPSLFEISLLMQNGRLSFTIEWSSDMTHQDGIRNWIETCQSAMRDCAHGGLLKSLACRSDYPLVSCDYNTLDDCMQRLLPRRIHEIEDIFPCSPCQEGMIVSQIRYPDRNLYNHETTWQVSSRTGDAVDVGRLEAACGVVIQRHQILRTVFCEVEGQQFPYIQVVFKDAASLKVQISTSDLPASSLVVPKPSVVDSSRFPYHLAICNSPEGVSCKFIINHALLDGSCLRILIQELSLLYNQVSLPSPPLYGSFISHLSSNPLDKSYAYWKSLLQDVGSCHFPSLNSGDESEATPGRLEVAIPSDQVKALREFCREHDATIAAFMNMVWALVLRTYIGGDAETVCFGYMASGRDVPVPGVHEMMGPLLNMLVQRVDVQPSTTVASLVQSVYDGLVRNLPHQNCSLAKIQSNLGLGGQGLFNTLVNVQKVSSVHQSDVSPVIEWELMGEGGPAEYDVIFGVVDSDQGINADLLYWTSCISESQAADLSETLLQVISSLLQAPSQAPISEIQAFSQKHARQLREWNSHNPHVVDSCLHQLFEEQVLLNPDAPAICTTGTEGNWTYAQLHDYSTRFATHLQSCGVETGMAVPFCFDRSPSTVASMLAILKSGGACLALDPSYPIQRLKAIIGITHARVIVCEEKYADIFDDLLDDVQIVKVSPQLWTSIPVATDYRASVTPSDPAFVNFTSGSTGVPKGNILEHKSIASALWHHRTIDPLGPQTRGLHFASYTFDMSFAEILLLLCSGGCLCIPTEYERLNSLAATINKLNVNWAYLTPTVASLLHPSDVPSLKTICLGGEPVLDTLVTKWMHEARLIATYGPSECSIAISRSEVRGFGNGQLGPASGGLLWIVDATNHDKLVPNGAPGELLIEGPLVGRDYLDSNLAKVAFIVDPAWTKDFPVPGVPQVGRRMYKTGDIVRFNQDGSMVMLGRKAEDGQAKIHGQRVDLSEVSHHLTASGIVKHAVCLVAKKGPFAKKLTAILSSMDLAEAILGSTDQPMILRDGPDARKSVVELRQWLEDRVPSYMIPRSWILLEKVPVTLNGKLNRRALLQWLDSIDSEAHESILSLNNDDETQNSSALAALSPMEEDIAQAWRHVLNIPGGQVTVNQSFFSLGGDSIAAIQVSSRLLSEGIQISMHDILQYRTLSEIAKRAKSVDMSSAKFDSEDEKPDMPFSLLSSRLSSSQFEDLMAKVARSLEDRGTNVDNVEDIYPCSPMQEGILFSCARQNDLYELVNDFKVIPSSGHGAISLEKFCRAIDQVVTRHQSLRSFFVEGDDLIPYIQVVQKSVEAPIVCISSSNHQEPFGAMTTDSAPLKGLGYRFVLCQILRTGDVYGRLEINHALIDGASMKNLIEDIRLAYDGLVPTSHSPPRYGDFINYLESLPSEKSLEHWTSVVQGLEPCILPSINTSTDRQRVCKAIDEILAPQNTQAVFKFCKNYDTTVATVISAAWSLVLRAYVGMDTVCFGYLTSGRAIPVPQAESIIGPLITMMVSRVDLSPNMSILEVTRGVHDSFLSGLEHQHTPLSAIQQAFDGGNQRGQMFNTVVNVLKGDLKLADASPSSIELEVLDAQGPTEYDVSLDVIHTDENISLSFSYWTSCLSDEQANLMQNTLIHVLDSLVQDASVKVGDLDLFSEVHRSQIMQWASVMPSTMQTCVHELVERKVEAQPDKDAIITSDMSISYQELDRLASCFAAHLASLGVGPEVMVPFCFDKSPWTIVVMYAILKAGGSCVALSPEFPDSRLVNMIEATQAALVICDSKHASRLQPLASKVIPIDTSSATVSAMLSYFNSLPGKSQCRAQSHHPAIIAFTSGSTGTPKGIILTHASLSTSIFAHGPLVHLSESSRVLQFSSYTFDASLEEIFTTLAFGGTICVPTEYERMNELSSFIKANRVNFASLTPTVASLLNPEELPLETVDIAGEMVPQNLASKWAAHTNLVVTYGPAECSIISSGMLIDPNHVQNGTLGKPAGTLMWIVDAKDHNKLVPIGCAGEILIEGPLLARGYINDEQTEKAFIFDPSWTKACPVPGADNRRRMYKTGDLARHEPDGSIIYLGRMDSQVKIHGQRVDLGEVETTLSRNGVDQSAAIVPKNGHFTKKLVTVFSLTNIPLANGQPLEAVTDDEAVANRIADLRKALQGSIPAYMLPRVWVPVKALPLNPNGKLDRRTVQRWLELLDEKTCEQTFALGSNIKPVTNLSKIEKLLVAVWSRVLGIPENTVGVDQPFFTLGGDSVAAIQVASRLRSEGIRLAVHDIFRHRTISALADIVRRDAPELEGITNPTDPEDDSFPLTPAQAMHFKTHADQIGNISQTYFFQLKRRVSLTEMNDAFVAFHERHPMLNARFKRDASGNWSQNLSRGDTEPLKLSSAQYRSTEEAMSSFLSTETCLNIETGPIVTACVADIGATNAEASQWLLVAMHELIADRASCQILLSDLEATLLHESSSPESTSYQAWVLAQQNTRRIQPSSKYLSVDSSVQYGFSEYWAMNPQLNSSSSTMVSEFTIDQDATSLIFGRANDALRTELIELLLSALSASFSSTFTDRPLPKIFSVNNGRDMKDSNIDVSRTFGCFTTVVPVCAENIHMSASSKSAPESKFAQMLRTIKDQYRLHYFNFTGAEEMEVLLTYIKYESLDNRLFQEAPLGNASYQQTLRRRAFFDVTATSIGGQLCFKFEYSKNMAHQNAISSWIRRFEELLCTTAQALVHASPVPTLSDFPLLSIKDYATLDSVIESCKSQAKVYDLALIESIHPCSPMQEGILFSTSRASSIYDAQEFWRVLPKSSDTTVDPYRLKAACESVISRHDILRTHLVEAHHGNTAFVQVVLKEVNAPIVVTTFKDLDDLMSQPLPQLHEAGTLPYLFTLCKLATGDIYLRLDISHALSDGVSTGILMRDLLQAYGGQPLSMGSTYRDYISHLESQSKDNTLEFWKQNLKDATPCHFPLLNESEVSSPPEHRSTSVKLSAEQKDRVREFCKLHNTTLANFMSAVWALVLPCFSDASSDTVTFGYLASGRDIPLADVNEILGPMITMLIRNANVRPEITVLQLIESMQQDFIQTWPHQHCSLGEIHHALGLSGTPLFNTIVNLGNAGGFKHVPESVPGDILFMPENVQSHSEYDIAFNILDSDKSFWLTLGYWDRCLSEDHANVLSHTVQAAISSVLENPAQSVSSVKLVDEFHMNMFQTWNADIPEPILDCIHDAFDRQVRLQPEAPAVCSIDPKVLLSYKQLDNMATTLAKDLQNLGVGPESLVPFCMDKSPWTPVAMIAILKAGGACVALDPKQPILRLKAIIEASSATVVVASPQHQGLFAGIVPNIVAVGEDSLYCLDVQVQAPQHAPATAQTNHNNPAFVIFTSGSTGTPKGIVVEHGAFCSSARSHAPILGLKRGTRVLQFASYTYDLSIAETFTTLMVGGCICVPSEYDRLNRLAAAINAMEVDWMFLTPTVAAFLQPEQVPLVRTLVLGGEHATHNNFSEWGGRPGICLINSYGPAECSIWTNANVGVKTTSDISNLGRRMGCSLWVADPRNHHRLFPMYARGELIIGGPTLARGYLHDTVKTEAAFIQPPDWYGKNDEDGQRLYKSGDLVHYTLDGSLSIQGRKDTQVKVHGHRIELDDINSNMASISLIEHATTQLPRTGPLEGRLVAVASLKEDRPAASAQQQILKVITDPNHTQNTASKLRQIRSELEKQLPKHMLPNVWILVEKMPLLSSGKLDKRTVKTWLDDMDDETYKQTKSMSTSDIASTLDLPENETEQALQQVWSEVLKCERATVGATVSFLSLGGDSISAMQAVSRARNAGINIFVQDIFRLKTIRKLAEQAVVAGAVDLPTSTPGRFGLLPAKGGQQIEQLINDCVSNLRLDETNVSIEDIFPCSPMQEGILISQAKSPDRYHVRALFEVLVQSTELVDVSRLERAWIKVAKRHQALRSVFLEGALDDASVLQVVLDSVTVPVLKLECDKLEDFTESVEVNEYAKHGPPYRFSICKLPSGVVYCHLAMTHALDDGSSMRVLLRDVCMAYDDLLPTGEPPLYSNFISYIQRQPKEVGLNYWKSYLNGVVPSNFPALTTSVSSQPTEDGIVERWIEGDQAGALLRLCEEHDITVADVFKTVWAIVLGSFLGAESVCFGYLASGRDAPVADVHNIMGPLINMLIFHANIEKSKSLVELCKEANDSYLHALPHQHCSLKEILHATRGAGQSTSLFNTVVNVQKGVTKFFVDEQDSTAHRTIDLRSRVFHDPTEYELSIDVQNFESSMLFLMNYWTSLLSAEQANGLADLVLAVVNRLLDDPTQTVGQLDLCTSGDLDVMSGWNQSPLVEIDRCLHDVIAEQASLKPDATAIISDEGSLTFRQLNEMANRLAHYLKELGVGPEIIVPTCFEKSIWAIVAMLGVLKAGAACAALEPAHPLERLQTIVKDTHAPFILSSRVQTTLVAQIGLRAVPVTESSLNSLPTVPTAPSADVKPDNKAFIVYTSGSTGTPKGAILEHRNLYASSRGFGTFGMNSESRVAHFSSYAFDVSIGETMLALTHGACVCIISEEDRLGDLTAALNRLQATFTQLTPTVLRTLEPSELPCMKTVVTAGELLTDDIINKWADRVQLFNSYGPCECAINSTGSKLLKVGARGALIGKPLQSRLYIVNPENDQLLVPSGAVGELVVNGPIVGRGYLNNPDRTEAAFMTAPPWASTCGVTGRFYKTGDLARWTSDGSIHYLGRKDVQVKIRGQRIELGEVECQIAEKAGSAFKAVVAAVPGGGILKQRLIVLLSLGDNAPRKSGCMSMIEDPDLRSRAMGEISDLREAVKKSLPRHMVPGVWIPVHNVPKLPSGKTNRRLINQWLEDMDQELHAEVTTSSQQKVIPPSSDMEAMLQRIWGDLLHLDASTISMDQSFFSLAGDSVLAMQLMARCRAEGVMVKVRDIFQHTTIAALAPYCTCSVDIEAKHNMQDDGLSRTSLSAIQESDLDLGLNMSNIEVVYPASPMQRSILSVQKTQKNAWFASFIVEASLSSRSGSSDLEVLAESWQKVVKRHDILRTIFKAEKNTGRYYQAVLKDFDAPVSYITAETSDDPADIFNLFPDMPEGDVPHHHIVLAETTSGSRIFMQLQISHALYDAVGISVLWHDLQVAYSSIRRDDVAFGDCPAVSYQGFISYIDGLSKSTAISYWKNHLTGTKPCFFPSLTMKQSDQLPSIPPPSVNGSFASVSIPIDRTSRIRTFCKQQAVTTANLFQAAWSLVLRHFTACDDVSFGFMLSGRDAPLPEVDSILGPLINLLPCTVKSSNHKTIESLLRDLQSTYAETLTNQNCSLEEIREVIGIKGPLYNTFLNMQRVTRQAPYSQSSVQFNEVNAFMADEYAISVYVSDAGDDIFMEMSYWTSILSDQDAEMVGQALLRALDVLFMAKPTDSPLSLKL
ncbi:hypothetical protein QQS21_000322 [Conoideocrella luteorostrata]|uniref:Carrier domain-containing protein n=1 Tax=Conoideocrella luteorostrata TaxID=1105319 RepID=A0AAJ0D1D4_9HYPO|nr:hypothetical protein QQS21_000322 [Conoideocrella luteorostrata]